MKKTLIILTLMTLSLQSFARTGQKAIYGQFDNEFITNNSPTNLKHMATGISLIVPKKNIRRYDKNTKVINARELSRVGNICRSERFSDNLASPGGCTGFLVAPNLVATAGHCIKDKNDCKRMNMVFGVTVAKEIESGFQIANNNIYSCKKIIKTTSTNELDFALIQLDRDVQARHIFELGDDAELTTKSSVYMMGHPMGLGVTYTEPGPVVSTISNSLFRARIDSFGGNSGSPVIDEESNKVVGILKGGQDDFIKEDGRCTRFARYNSGSEVVSRINLIKDSLEK